MHHLVLEIEFAYKFAEPRQHTTFWVSVIFFFLFLFFPLPVSAQLRSALTRAVTAAPRVLIIHEGEHYRIRQANKDACHVLTLHPKCLLLSVLSLDLPKHFFFIVSSNFWNWCAPPPFHAAVVSHLKCVTCT